MKRLLIILLVFNLGACADFTRGFMEKRYGKIQISTSSFDGKKEIKLTPVPIKPTNISSTLSDALFKPMPPSFKVGLSWKDNPEDNVLLIVEVSQFGGSSITNYTNINDVSLNIDGDMVDLKSLEDLTNHSSKIVTNARCSLYGCSSGDDVKTSSKMFEINFQQLEDILTASSAKIKISSGREYNVGDLKALWKGNITLIERLPDFINEVKTAIPSKDVDKLIK